MSHRLVTSGVDSLLALGRANKACGRVARAGAWRSLVAHLLWEQGVARSNRAAPTTPIAAFAILEVKPQMPFRSGATLSSSLIVLVVPVVLVVLASLATVGCAGDGIVDSTPTALSCNDDPNFPFDPELSCIQEMVLTPRCAVTGCHVGSGQAGLTMVEGLTYSEWVGVASTTDPNFMRVSPGVPDDSYVVMKLEGDPRIGGARMPFGGPPLNPKKIAVIREWILRGAMDD